jgi:hypothetical protein
MVRCSCRIYSKRRLQRRDKEYRLPDPWLGDEMMNFPHRTAQSRRKQIGVAAFLMVGLTVTFPLLAADDPADVSSPFVRDSTLLLQLRSLYLDREKSAAPDSVTWAGGGWLEYRSGWAFDLMRLGLTGYTAQKLYGPADKDGASVLATGQHPYSVLGEALVALKHNDQVFMAGRFLVDQHEVNPQDTRMSPRTFQGAALSGKAGIIEYFGSYITQMKTRNSADFVGVATAAGAPASIDEPLLLLSGRIVPEENLRFGFSSYRIRNILTSTYVDATKLWPTGENNKLRLGGQYMRQSSTGANLLTGAPFSTDSAGIKLDWLQGPLTLSGSLMSTKQSAAYRTPFGSWQGYASRIITSFNRAGEKVHSIDAALNLEHVGAPGLTINASATFGSGAIDAATSAALSDNVEYDLTVNYRLSNSAWPQWARPLCLRARIGRLEQRLSGVNTVTNERQFIANYTATLK